MPSPVIIERNGVKCELRNCDCLPFMRELPDKAFDLAIVDPPYGIGRDGSLRTTSRHGGRKAHEFKGWDSASPDADYFKALFRVSKNQIVWGANYFTAHLPPSMGWVFWDKGQRICNSDGELAFSSFDRAMRVAEYNRVELLREGTTIHPTQKPVALYSWLLANYAEAGQTILDTHLGSGSIAIACLNHGYNLTACELDEDYFKAATERIQREANQGVML